MSRRQSGRSSAKAGPECRLPQYRPRAERLETRRLLSVFTITNTSDSGAGSLRQAILDANTASGADTIQFQIPGTGVHTITPTSALPQITGPVTFDISQEPGYTGKPLIELDGAQAGASSDGLVVAAGNSTITGLIINRFRGDGIRLLNNGGDVIEGNYIGTNTAGTAALPNALDGIGIDGVSNDTIGGTAAADLNLLSGNKQTGVFVIGSGTDGGFTFSAGANNNVIEGNYIGTDVTGNAALGNAQPGVQLDGADHNLVGGTDPAARNLISGGVQNGIDIFGTGATGNLVEGNYLGTNAAGTMALGNTFTTIAIHDGASNNTIGGTDAGARNIISGGHNQGVSIFGDTTTGNLVEGNYIGTNANGTVAIGNVLGVEILLGAHGNMIGGTATGAGNLISGNQTGGVAIDGGGGTTVDPATDNVVAGNYIGTNRDGTTVLGNGSGFNSFGISIFMGASTNLVGGTTAGARNVISGNNGDGITLKSPHNTIQGNFVGMNAAGTAALANAYFGINIEGVASDTIVGGADPGAGNVISGNGSDNIAIGTAGNIVQGNYIGTNAAGTAALRNGSNGIELFSPPASDNTIGGAAAGARNVISGNTTAIIIAGPGSNHVEGNYIGIDATGTIAIPNLGGIWISDSANNTIGGTTGDQRNLIAFNSGSGIWVSSNTSTTAAVGNAILGNSIFSNKSLGIDLGGDGVTLNKPGGPHSGPNELQNFPVLSAASSGNAGTIVTGRLNSAANSSFRIELFASKAADPSGYGQGQTFLGFTNLQTDAAGNGSFTFTAGIVVPAGQVITATATDASNDTSEFSKAIRVVSRIAPQVTGASYVFSSSPHALTFTFNEDVASSLNDPSVLQVQNLSTMQAVTPASVSWNAVTNTATYTFSGVLPDGNYRATLPASAVSSTAGDHPDADYSYSFFFLSGDVNHDGKVDFKDLVALASHYGTPSSATFDQGDLNYDGAVNFNDLVILASNYGKSLVTATAAVRARTRR